ncbi:hypothetical protein [Halomonas llamarensis]|uniref:hypothetical protein n=1 Tax=Halomonas llamarensis TaxID=2945104 RepID=UPI003D32ABE7
MNASKILQQLMQQAGGSQKGSGVDVQGMLSGLSKQFGGGSQGPSRQQNASSSSSDFDMKSLLGGGVMGLLVGSKRQAQQAG